MYLRAILNSSLVDLYLKFDHSMVVRYLYLKGYKLYNAVAIDKTFVKLFQMQLLVQLSLLTVPVLYGSCTVPETLPLLLFVDMDGFRHDYLERLDQTKIPNFRFFIDNGVKARCVRNIFPSVTFANQMTLMTGLYAESHGVVQNNFYDPVFNETFYMEILHQNFESKWFDNGGEPILATNEKAGHRRHSGVILLPGNLAPIKGVHQKILLNSYLYNTTEEIPYNFRIDTIINWFIDSSNPINFGVLYFPEPDESGHYFGPDSKIIDEKIYELDNALGYLRHKLEVHGLFKKINIIITSDHGMVKYQNKSVNLDTILDRSFYRTVSEGRNVVTQIIPKPGKEDLVYKTLLKHQEGMYVYKKGSQELRKLHFNDNRRIMPIVLEPKKGWIIGNNDTIAKFEDKGLHGYDPQKVSDVRPFFIAYGPAFIQGYVIESIDSVDIYSLMCHLLKIQPAHNNGTMEHVKDLLKDHVNCVCHTLSNFTAVLLIFMLKFLLCELFQH